MELVTFGDSEDHYSLNNGIKRKKLAANRPGWVKFLAIFNYFLFAKTNCVISYTQRASSFVLWPLLFRPRINVINCERSFTPATPGFYEKLLVKFLYHRADSIVTNSFSQKNHLLKYRPKWENKIYTIINYTEIDRYPFMILPNNKPRQIGVFARYSHAKNCIRVAQAVSKVREMTTIPFVVKWFGSFDKISGTPNPYLDALRKEITDLHIEDVFLLNNHVKNVSDLMPGFDAVLLPSIYEGFSNAISEAICCGKPVLASNVSDNGIMVKDGVNGFLFDPMSVDEIANAFVRYLNSLDQECEKMGAQSRIMAEKLFDKDAFIRDYINLIEK